MRSGTSTTPIDRDLQNVVADTQEQLKTMENEGGAQVNAARERARTAVQTADGHVRSNPWLAVGISAAIGAVVGFLVSRR